MYLVIYEKRNGDIIKRKRFSLPGHTIGEYTSMGWKIIDILWFYDGEYYSFPDYCRIKRERR